MTTPYIGWKDDYSVGNRELDQQHQRIFKLLSELHQALQEGQSTKSATALLDEAGDYARQHFETEERLMAEAGYPGLEEHKQAHREYWRRVGEIRHIAEAEKPYELFLFLKDWWVNHVTQLDRDYAPSLKKLSEH